MLPLLFALGAVLSVPAAQVKAVTTCTTTVTTASGLQSAINRARSGWTICLGKSIRATSKILVDRKSGVTIHGRGYTLTSAGYHTAVQVHCSSGVKIRDLVIVGSHPQPGTFVPGREHAHGIHVEGGRDLRFYRVDVRNMQGDGFYVGACNTTWADGVLIMDSRVASNGRQGIAVVAGRNVQAGRMRFHNIAFSIIDIEPDWNTAYRQGATDLAFVNAVSTGWVGRFTSGLVDAPAFTIATPYGAVSGAYAPDVARIRIEGYRIEGGITGIRTTINPNRGYRIRDVIIRNNVGLKQMAGIGAGDAMVMARDVDRLTVTGNRNPVRSGAYAVAVWRSTGATASANIGPGLAGQIIRH